jgi:hypothetical protein
LVLAAEAAKPKPEPEFQNKSEGISISIPSANDFWVGRREEIFADFIKGVPEKITLQKETENVGQNYYSGSWTSIWRSLGFAEWDKHVTGKLSEHTDRSLREMFTHQSANGTFVSYGEIEIGAVADVNLAFV